MAQRHAADVSDSAECSAESTDEEPLVNMKRRLKDQSDSKKRKASRGGKSVKVLPGEDSDDGSWTKAVKKTRRGSSNKKTKASASKIRATTSKQARKTRMPESTSNRTHVETVNKAAAHPHVTKDLRVSLLKCHVEEAEPSGDQNKTRTESADESPSESTDDEPLAKKKRLKVQSEVTYSSDDNKTKQRRRSKLLKVNNAEYSAESSDDEPLAQMKTRLRAPSERKASSDNKKPKSTRGRSLLKVNYAEYSSDDEPLSKMKRRIKASPSLRYSTNSKKTKPGREDKLLKGSKSNRSDDETLIKAAYPQVTMDLRVSLVRCPVEEADPPGDLNKSETANCAEPLGESSNESSDDVPLEKLKASSKASFKQKTSSQSKKLK